MILSVSFCVSSPTVFVFVSSHGSVVQYIGRLRLLYCDSLTVSVSFPVVFVFISSHVSVIQHIGNGRPDVSLKHIMQKQQGRQNIGTT